MKTPEMQQQQITSILHVFGENMLMKYPFNIDPQRVIYGQSESWLESKAKAFPGCVETVFGSLDMKGFASAPSVIHTRPGLDPDLPRSLSFPSQLLVANIAYCRKESEITANPTSLVSIFISDRQVMLAYFVWLVGFPFTSPAG